MFDEKLEKSKCRKTLPPSAAGDIVDKIGKEWMLIGIRDGDGANAMTASWGTMGTLWNKPVCTCYIRPQRYSFGLAEKEERISLSFFGKGRRDALGYCGKYSGRNEDKLANAGLSYAIEDDVPIFDDAELTLVCRKIYSDMIRENCFIEKNIIDNCYPQKDFHRFYVLEIEKCIVKIG